jgi:hypothetical protein
MKQLISLFIFLLPCLAWAQYPSNGNQKITLGEQTTADGLVYRGVASIDTLTATNKITRANKQDTSVFILLDTVTNLLWHYKTASNGWSQAGGSTLDTATMLLPYWRSGRFSGVLPVLNGGTGSATQNFVDLTTTQSSIAGAKTFTSAVTATRFNPTASTLTGTGMFLPVTNTLGFSTDGVEQMRILSNGNVGIGTASPSAKLHLNNNASVTTFDRIIQGRSASNNSFVIGVSDPNTYFAAAGAGGLRFAVNSNLGVSGISVPSNVAMTILSTGNVGIGTENPVVQLHTTGTIRYATFAGGGSSTITVDNSGDLTRTSSIQLKKDVTAINYGLNEILQINPINFNWIDEDKFGNENENGFIAEDVMSIIPNVVGSDIHGIFMDYTKLIPILTKAIQEQQAQIEALKQRLLILENK